MVFGTSKLITQVEFIGHSTLLSYLSETSTTALEADRRAIPIGIKATPMRRNVKITGSGVRIGCQAGNCCCLKAVRRGFFERLEVSLDIQCLAIN